MAAKKKGRSKPKVEKVTMRGYSSPKEGRSTLVGKLEWGGVLIEFERPARDEEKQGKRACVAVTTRRVVDKVITTIPLQHDTAEALYYALADYFKK